MCVVQQNINNKSCYRALQPLETAFRTQVFLEVDLTAKKRTRKQIKLWRILVLKPRAFESTSIGKRGQHRLLIEKRPCKTINYRKNLEIAEMKILFPRALISISSSSCLLCLSFFPRLTFLFIQPCRRILTISFIWCFNSTVGNFSQEVTIALFLFSSNTTTLLRNGKSDKSGK